MATFEKRGQGLLLLALVLLAFSVIPAPVRGEKIDGSRKSGRMGMIAGDDNKAAIIHDDDKFNGCHYNQGVHDDGTIFCCSKDSLCWPSLTVCVNNCPCKVNC